MGLSKNWLVLSEPPILLQDSSQAPENVNKKFKNNVTAQYSKLYDKIGIHFRRINTRILPLKFS